MTTAYVYCEEKKGNGLDKIKMMANRRKNDTTLRHSPNSCDINVANSNAHALSDQQYKTIK